MPTTSIYSKSDGVVAWQCSLNDAAPHTENVEIHASHMGLGVNPLALYIVADRLRQDPAQWQRFDAQALKDFHDMLLAGGALPLEVLDEQVDAWITRRRQGL